MTGDPASGGEERLQKESGSRRGVGDARRPDGAAVAAAVAPAR